MTGRTIATEAAIIAAATAAEAKVDLHIAQCAERYAAIRDGFAAINTRLNVIIYGVLTTFVVITGWLLTTGPWLKHG